MEAEFSPRGHTTKHAIHQFLNFLTFLLGIIFLIIIILLWSKIKNFNTFILVGMLISFYIIFVTVFGFAKARHSPDGLILYFVLILILEIAFIIFTVYLYQDKASIVEFLVKNMDDSYDAILEATRFAGRNLDVIKVLLVTYICILVNTKLIYRRFLFFPHFSIEQR